MLKYLVILLSDDCTSICQYENSKASARLIPIETLRKGIIFGMKENLAIQFVLPDYELPTPYYEAINEIDHISIAQPNSFLKPDITVLNGWSLSNAALSPKGVYILRTTFEDFKHSYFSVPEILLKVQRLNIIFTDIESIDLSSELSIYQTIIDYLISKVVELFKNKQTPELNLLTDRLYLTSMNNCEAGNEVITLAPDGKFYVCPAFYYAKENPIGNLEKGLSIPNGQLYKREFAPICRRCDAYQCKRCIWLNKRLTLECNTPSHEQCVLSHIERNGSARLSVSLDCARLNIAQVFDECNYLDPFDLFAK